MLIIIIDHISTGVAALRRGRGRVGRGELQQHSGDVDGANSAFTLFPRRGGDGVAGAFPSFWRRSSSADGADRMARGGDGVSRSAPSALAARWRQSLCNPVKEGGRQEKAS